MIEVIEQAKKAEHVGSGAKTTDGTDARSSGDRVVSERFACSDVREVNLGDRDTAGTNCVVQDHGGVRESCTVEHDAVEVIVSGTSDPRDELAFVVGLSEDDFDTFARGDSAHGLFDVGKRSRSVDGRLSLAESIQVGTGDDEDAFSRGGVAGQVSSLSNDGARVRSMYRALPRLPSGRREKAMK